MKKKIVLFGFILIGVLSLILTYKLKQNNLNKNKPVKEEKLSIMIKELGATDYAKSSSKDIPKGNYTMNTEKSFCENNGKIEGYDSTTGTVSFAFIGTDKCFLYFDYKATYAYETILMDNGAENGKASSTNEAINYISSKGDPDFAIYPETNEGLYKTEDYQGSSYYFRGAVDNNWVIFGDSGASSPIYWRIIRINGDNSIRLIYSFGSEGSACSSLRDKDNFNVIGCNTSNRFLTAFSSSKNTYGLKYTDNEQHGNTNNNAILDALYGFYEYYNLDVYRDYFADTIYINDRTAYNTDGNEIDSWVPENNSYYFGSYERLNRSSPKLNFVGSNADIFSTRSDIANIDYPIGLLTAEEANMAGAMANQTSCTNCGNYLNTINGAFWTMSPMQTNPDYIACISTDASTNGGYTYLEFCDPTSEYSVRPVISLKANTIFRGSGTYNNPYSVVG